jgi:hypothetical protein
MMKNVRNRRFRRLFVALGAWLTVAAVSVVMQPKAGAIIVARTAVAYRPRPVVRAAVATTAVVATAVAVGTIVNSVPPSCSSVMVGNVAYQQCGSTWYQPRYSGSQVTYVVVNPPH